MSRMGKVLLYLIYSAAIIVLGGSILASAKVGEGSVKTPRTAQHQQTTVADTKNAGSTVSKTLASSNRPATPATANQTAGVTGSTLTDTGPGNMVLLFVTSSIAGTFGCYYRLVRRAG